ncbi:MAG: hypothetical protein OXC27_16870, partial [Caldilineaceae bacterium]|nr:hypothetical protein [Caldilineaceae bacterium]
MTKRNPNPDPEIFELTTTRKPEADADTIVLQQGGVPRHDAVQDTLQASADRGAYHIWTIGCQMNVADSNHVAAELERIGYRPTEAMDEADIVVLNTCVVRQSAEDKG